MTDLARTSRRYLGEASALFVAAFALTTLWSFTHEGDPDGCLVRQVYGVNALMAMLWGGVWVAPRSEVPSLRAQDAAAGSDVGSDLDNGAAQLGWQTGWTALLWGATSLAFAGTWFLDGRWATWVLLLMTLLVLGALPVALSRRLSYRAAQFVTLIGAGVVAAGVLVLGWTNPLTGASVDPTIKGGATLGLILIYAGCVWRVWVGDRSASGGTGR